MLIFIDESGIHKSVDQSTFVLVYIEIENYLIIDATIKEQEAKLGLEYFHWSETVWHVKEQFLDKILNLNFKVKVAVVKNPVDPAQELERVLSHMLIEKGVAHIFIDGKKPKWQERKIKKILRDKAISIKKLSTTSDRSESGIRFADMVAGLTRWYFDGKNLKKIEKYYQRLQKKILVIIE